MQTRIPALVLVAVALSIVGCGSSKSGSTSSNASASSQVSSTSQNVSNPPLSTAQLLARANAICKRSNARLAHADDKVSEQAELSHVAPAHAAIEQAALTELSKLTPPSSMADAWQQVIAARTKLIEQLTKLGEAAAAANSEEVDSLMNSGGNVSEQVITSAKRLGLTDCAIAS